MTVDDIYIYNCEIGILVVGQVYAENSNNQRTLINQVTMAYTKGLTIVDLLSIRGILPCNSFQE